MISLLCFSQSAPAQFCDDDDTPDPPRRDFANDKVLYIQTNLSRELSKYKVYTIPLDENTAKLMHGTINDFSTIIADLSPDFDKKRVTKLVAARINKFGPNGDLIVPALELIEQAYILERPEFAAPLIGIIGRANPHMGFVSLQKLRKDGWGSLTSTLRNRSNLIAASDNIFGPGINILSEDKVIAAFRGKITSSRAEAVQSFFGGLTGRSWMNPSFQSSTIPVLRGRMDSLYKFDSFSKSAVPDFSKSPFANYTDSQGIIIDRNYQLMSGWSGVSGSFAKVGWHYSKEIAKKCLTKSLI
ncbi:hypothetical protein [Oligoflexus sp.]|uniref:hypothetical protein n=1 Tax=Oligoflexus sp. TaxID=1971216 RepID=UPI002D781681|nr:hypothetical protein [Oligoflexus sp.]